MAVDEMSVLIALHVITFLYGIVIGSFLNVCILRIPLKESVASKRSHCMSCGYQLRWYDLVPLFSYLFLHGRCRKCSKHISVQYPIVEGLNGLIYVLIFTIYGWSINSVIYCLFASATLVSLVIDYRMHEIPRGADIFILALGLINLGFHLGDWVSYGISLFAVSVFAGILYCFKRIVTINKQELIYLIVSSALFRWQVSIVILLAGFVFAALTALIYRLLKKEKSIRVGACMAVAFLVAALAGRIV